MANCSPPNDAIYATSVAEQLADCLDVAVIDYNFYDGYSLSADARVLPMLANQHGLGGYQQIMVGAYAEQWERLKNPLELRLLIKRTLSTALAQPKVIGYEVGGLQRQLTHSGPATIDLEKLQSLRVQPVVSATASPGPGLAIGILFPPPTTMCVARRPQRWRQCAPRGPARRLRGAERSARPCGSCHRREEPA